MRLIDAEKAIKDIKDNPLFLFGGITQSDVGEFIRRQPTIDAVPVRHGRWVDGYCDQCEEQAPYSPLGNGYTYQRTNYCPYCGAIMDKGDDHGLD